VQLESQEIGAEESGQDLTSPRSCMNSSLGGTDVQKESDVDVRAKLAQHLRDQLS